MSVNWEMVGAIVGLLALSGAAVRTVWKWFTSMFEGLRSGQEKVQTSLDEGLRDLRQYVDKKDEEILEAMERGFAAQKESSEQRHQHTEALFREAFASKADVARIEGRLASFERGSSRSLTPPRAPSAPASGKGSGG